MTVTEDVEAERRRACGVLLALTAPRVRRAPEMSLALPLVAGGCIWFAFFSC
jgi:hypothetical protein